MRPILVHILLGLVCQNSLACREAEQTVSYDKILEKLTKLESQIAGLQKDAQQAKIVEVWLQPTKEPVTEIIDSLDESLLEKYEKIGSKYYHIGDDETLDWHDALDKCKSIHGSLLSLRNEGEWQAITARLNREKSYWVDINDRKTKGEFISETTGLKAPFLKWDIEEPNNLVQSYNRENCVELRSGYNMNNICCCNEKNYVCEANIGNFIGTFNI